MRRPPGRVAILGTTRGWRQAGLRVGWICAVLLGLALLYGRDPAGVAFVALGLAGFALVGSAWAGVTLSLALLVLTVFALTQGSALAPVEAVGAGALLLASGYPLVAGRVGARAPHPAPAAVTAMRPAAEQPAPPAVEPATAAGEPTLRIRSIGEFVVAHGGEDLTGDLRRKSKVGFIWIYLLVRAARSPEERMKRESLANEMSPDLSSADQMKAVKGLVYDLLHDLPSSLTAIVDAQEKTIRLDLSGAVFDVVRLRRLEAECSAAGALIDQGLAARVKAELTPLGAGEFLPEFDEWAERATDNNGEAAAVVNQVRLSLAATRGNLALALAEHQLASGMPGAAVLVLETALKLDRNREDLARRLVAAHLEAGQTRRAAEVRARFQLTGEQA